MHDTQPNQTVEAALALILDSLPKEITYPPSIKNKGYVQGWNTALKEIRQIFGGEV